MVVLFFFFWNSKVYDHVCTQPWQNLRHASLTISVLDKIVFYFLPAQPKGESIYNLLIFKLHFSRQNQVTMRGLSLCFPEKKDGSTNDTKLQSILVHLLENNIFMICTYLSLKKNNNKLSCYLILCSKCQLQRNLFILRNLHSLPHTPLCNLYPW